MFEKESKVFPHIREGVENKHASLWGDPTLNIPPERKFLPEFTGIYKVRASLYAPVCLYLREIFDNISLSLFNKHIMW